MRQSCNLAKDLARRIVVTDQRVKMLFQESLWISSMSIAQGHYGFQVTIMNFKQY